MVVDPSVCLALRPPASLISENAKRIWIRSDLILGVHIKHFLKSPSCHNCPLWCLRRQSLYSLRKCWYESFLLNFDLKFFIFFKQFVTTCTEETITEGTAEVLTLCIHFQIFILFGPTVGFCVGIHIALFNRRKDFIAYFYISYHCRKHNISSRTVCDPLSSMLQNMNIKTMGTEVQKR